MKKKNLVLISIFAIVIFCVNSAVANLYNGNEMAVIDKYISENTEITEIEFKPDGTEFGDRLQPYTTQEKTVIRDVRPSNSAVKPINLLNKRSKNENFNFEWRAPDLIRN